jgi:broad specificity phosphatase PhoE
VPIIFETHSTSFDNEAGLASGWYDVDLSPLGESQARELGTRYEGVRIDAICASDLRRAWRTVEIAFGADRPYVRDPRLRECDYGTLTRHPAAAIDGRRLACVDEPFPGGESYADATARVGELLQELRGAHGVGTVLLVGHRATWYALEHLLNGRPLAEVIAAPWQWQPGWWYRSDQV